MRCKEHGVDIRGIHDWERKCGGVPAGQRHRNRIRIHGHAVGEQRDDRQSDRQTNQGAAPVHAASAVAYASSRGIALNTERRRRGHMLTSAPNATMKLPIQIHTTSGSTITSSVAVEPSCANASRFTYRSLSARERTPGVVMGGSPPR